jgi:hypothetical protein
MRPAPWLAKSIISKEKNCSLPPSTDITVMSSAFVSQSSVRHSEDGFVPERISVLPSDAGADL